MSVQKSIDFYFKSKSINNNKMFDGDGDGDNKPRKRLRLSRNKATASKSPKIMHEFKEKVSKVSTPLGVLQNCNEAIIIDDSEDDVFQEATPRTPQKTVSSTPSSGSGGSKRKFYSPVKKRVIPKKTSPVKRNLSRQYFQPMVAYEDQSIYEGIDDKTIFMLTIIIKCLNNNKLIKLMDTSSQEILMKCPLIIKPGMRLVCRLYWRQNTWYRRDELINIINESKKNLVDDSKVNEIMDYLVKNDFIKLGNSNDNNRFDFDTMTHKLKADELKQICKELNLKTLSKKNAVNVLKNHLKEISISRYFITKCQTVDNNTRVHQVLQKNLGVCYKITDILQETLYKLYILMYLGVNYNIIREKKLELMLLHDKIKRETFPIDKDMEVDDASVVFTARDQFEKYCSAHSLYEHYISEEKESNKCRIVEEVYEMYKNISANDMDYYKSLPVWLRRYTPAYIYVKMLEVGVESLKRSKTSSHLRLAVNVLSTLLSQHSFRVHKKSLWYVEKAKVLDKYLHDYDEAAQVLLDGLQSDLSEDAKESLRHQAVKVTKGEKDDVDKKLRNTLVTMAKEDIKLERNFCAEHVYKNPVPNSNKGKLKYEVFINDIRQAVDVEEFCIWHYMTTSTEYTNGEHWEGRIVNNIFLLLFWDIVYTKPCGKPGIFLSHYQTFPLDMYYDSFYTNRKMDIDKRLKDIKQSSVEDMLESIRTAWEKRPESELSGLTRSIELESICEVAGCLGPRAVSAICSRLAKDYGHSHSGFPDVTLWNKHSKKIKFVEVKSDADRPSVKQLQWMHYLKQNDIDTGFLYVGVNTDRNRARNSGRHDT